MSEYYRVSTRLKLSALDDFSVLNPGLDLPDFDGSYDYVEVKRVLVPAATYLDVTPGASMTSMRGIIVYNRHSTAYLNQRVYQYAPIYTAGAGNITWVAEAGTTPAHVLDAGNGFADFDSRGRFDYGHWVTVTGATAGANNTRFLVQTTGAGVLYFASSPLVASSGTLVAGVDAGTPSFQSEYYSHFVIPPGGHSYIPGPQAAGTGYHRHLNIALSTVTSGSADVPADVVVLGA
jgi:hypothetical protein